MSHANYKNCLFCCAGVQMDNPREDFDEDEFRRKLEIFAHHCSISPKLIPVNCDPVTFPLCLRCQERVDAIAESHDAIQAASGIISFQIGNIQGTLMKLDWLKKGRDDAFKPARDKILENSKMKLNSETEKWMKSCWVHKVINGKVILQLEPLPPQPDVEGRSSLEANGGVNLQLENKADAGLHRQDNGEGVANLTSGDGKYETSGSQGGEGGGVDNQDVFQNSDDETEDQLPTSPRPSPSSGGVTLSTEKRSRHPRRTSTNPNASSRSDDDDDFDDKSDLSPEVTQNKRRKLGSNGDLSGRLPNDVEEPGVNLPAKRAGASSQPVNSTSLLASPDGIQKLSV